MLFLKPATSKQRLITGLSAAVEETTLDATYVTLNNNGHRQPTRLASHFLETTGSRSRW